MANTVVRISDVPVATISDNTQFLTFDSGNTKTRLVESGDLKNYVANNLPYGIVSYYPGIPESNTIIMGYIAGWFMSFPNNMEGSKGFCKVPSSANADFLILKNGTSVGTIRFIPESSEAIFLQNSAFDLNVNDLLEVQASEVADITLSHISLTLSGNR